MSHREVTHTRRTLTPQERERVVEARRLIAGEEAEIRRKAREYKHAYEAARATLQDAMKLLKSERERLGLSLADVSERMGIERPNLSRLENGPEANPTVATLSRYADALGKRLMIVLTDPVSGGG
jgi:ribosome-binding protein aMBF1 (putative translation factor)